MACQKLWKAVGALRASRLSSVPLNLLFSFKNIPTYVEAQFRVILSLSPAFLVWNITHVHTLLPAQLETITKAAVSIAIKLY